MPGLTFYKTLGQLLITGGVSTLAAFLAVEAARDSSLNCLRFLPLVSYLALIVWSIYLSFDKRSPHALCTASRRYGYRYRDAVLQLPPSDANGLLTTDGVDRLCGYVLRHDCGSCAT